MKPCRTATQTGIDMQQVAIGLGYSALGTAVAFLYGVSAYCLGELVCRKDTANFDGLAAPIRIASGAAIFSLLFSTFAVLAIANKWVIISIPAIILLAASTRAIATTDELYHRNL